MVSSNQVFDLVLIAVGAYIAIVHGPAIVKAFKDFASQAGKDSGGDSGGGGSAPTTDSGIDLVDTPLDAVPSDDGSTDLSQPGNVFSNPTGHGTDLSQPNNVFSNPSRKGSAKSHTQSHKGLSRPGQTVSQAPPAPKSVDSTPPHAMTPAAIPDVMPPTPQLVAKHPSAPLAKPQLRQRFESVPTNTGKRVVRSRPPPPPEISSRFPVGDPARDLIESNLMCHCNGKTCCFRGHTCDGSIGSECSYAASAAAKDQNVTCTMLHQRFLAHNQCGPRATPKPVALKSRFKPITPAPLTSRFKKSAYAHAYPGIAYGDGGQLISLDAMNVTIA